MMMLSVPAVEITTPRVMSKPPVAPQKFRPASARGRSEFPRPGKVPRQTNWINIKRIAVKATADKRAKGKLRPGSLVSPETIPAYSNPLNVKTESITAWENDLKLVPGTTEKLANLTKNIPAATNNRRGTNLPMTKMLLTIAPCRTPSRLKTASAMTIALITATRHPPDPAGGQK